jgi:hypothetical protein
MALLNCSFLSAEELVHYIKTYQMLTFIDLRLLDD